MFSPVGLNPKLGSANWLGHVTILESFFLFLTNRPPNLLLQATLRVMPVLVTFTSKRMFTKFLTHNAVFKFLKRYTSSPVPTCKTCSLWHFPKVILQSLNFKPFVSVTVQDTTWRPPLATSRLLLTAISTKRTWFRHARCCLSFHIHSMIWKTYKTWIRNRHKGNKSFVDYR